MKVVFLWVQKRHACVISSNYVQMNVPMQMVLEWLMRIECWVSTVFIWRNEPMKMFFELEVRLDLVASCQFSWSVAMSMNKSV